MSDQWFVRRSGNQHGPFSLEQIKNGVASDKLKPTDHLWKEGMVEYGCRPAPFQAFSPRPSRR